MKAPMAFDCVGFVLAPSKAMFISAADNNIFWFDFDDQELCHFPCPGSDQFDLASCRNVVICSSCKWLLFSVKSAVVLIDLATECVSVFPIVADNVIIQRLAMSAVGEIVYLAVTTSTGVSLFSKLPGGIGVPCVDLKSVSGYFVGNTFRYAKSNGIFTFDCTTGRTEPWHQHLASVPFTGLFPSKHKDWMFATTLKSLFLISVSTGVALSRCPFPPGYRVRRSLSDYTAGLILEPIDGSRGQVLWLTVKERELSIRLLHAAMGSPLRLAAEQDIGLSTMTASYQLYLQPFQVVTSRATIDVSDHAEIVRFAGSALFLTPLLVAMAPKLSQALKAEIIFRVYTKGNIFVAVRLAWALFFDLAAMRTVSLELHDCLQRGGFEGVDRPNPDVSPVVQFAVSLLWAVDPFSVDLARREDKGVDTLSATIAIFFIVEHMRRNPLYHSSPGFPAGLHSRPAEFVFLTEAGVLAEFASCPHLSNAQLASRNFMKVDDDSQDSPCVLNWDSLEKNPSRPTPIIILIAGRLTVVCDVDECMLHVESTFVCFCYSLRTNFLIRRGYGHKGCGRAGGVQASGAHARSHCFKVDGAQERRGTDLRLQCWKQGARDERA
jgi:hypothetical protein